MKNISEMETEAVEATLIKLVSKQEICYAAVCQGILEKKQRDNES